MTIEEIYENARRRLDKSEITIGEFAEIVGRDVYDVAGFLLINEKECRFEWQGKEYVMRVEEYQEDTDE